MTDKEIDRIADLAELSIDESERERIREDMRKMLDFVDQLKEADIGAEETSTGPDPSVFPEGVFREDDGVDFDDPEDLVQAAPKKARGMYVVPRSI